MQIQFGHLGTNPIGVDNYTISYYLFTTCCDTQTDQEGIEITWCTVCQMDDKGNVFNCGPRFQPQQGLPPSAGKLSNAPPITSEFNSTTTANPPNPTSTPPALSITKEHNLASPKGFSSPSKQQQQTTTPTTTCPDGSQPDANGNCPATSSTTTNQQANTSPTPTTQHHHKGSNNLQGGQESTPTPTAKKGQASKTG